MTTHFRGPIFLAIASLCSGARNHATRRVPVKMGLAILAAILSRLTSRRPFVAILLAVAGSLSGCATVKEGHDPVVVNAERTLAISFEAIDGFLRAEHQQRDWMRANAPMVHSVAESLRLRAPQAFAAAKSAVRTYKRERTPDNAGKIRAAIVAVSGMGIEATSALAQIQTP